MMLLLLFAVHHDDVFSPQPVDVFIERCGLGPDAYVDKAHWISLCVAAAAWYPEIAVLLLRKEANRNLENNSCDKSIQLARKGKQEHVVPDLKRTRTICRSHPSVWNAP